MPGERTADSAADSAVGQGPPALILQPHGGALLRRGKPGNRGGGRTPDEFKARLAELISREDVLREVELILTDRNHPHFVRALEWATDRVRGRVPNRIEGDVRTVSGVILLPEPSWGAPTAVLPEAAEVSNQETPLRPSRG